jgi:signal transduction histidine kinase
LLFDGLIGAIAVATLLWVVFLNEVTAALGDAPTWQRLVGSTYVLLDVSVVVTVMIVVVRRSNLRFDLRLVLFAFGAILFTAADVAFLINAAGRSFTEAEPIYALYMLAATLFLATALIVDRAPAEREYAERARTPLWAMALPYGTAAIMVALLVARAPGVASSSDAGLLYSTLAIGGLVIARQAVAIRENRRLVEAQQTALVSSISHELRTPLTAMVGFLELLDAGAITDPVEREEMTSIVSEQASHLGRIVSDLVMLASERIATMDLDISPTAIDDLAWAAIGNAAVDATSVRVHAQRGVVAYVDPGRVKQALANLLGNAARYGGEKVLVVAKAEAGNLLLEVHDDGPGVPRKYELLIWEKFERGPNRLNSAMPGSGIGLPVTDAIARAHGGSAGYRRSERLGGACFWMRLPGRVHGHDYPSSGTVTRLNVIDSAEDARSA